MNIAELRTHICKARKLIAKVGDIEIHGDNILAGTCKTTDEEVVNTALNEFSHTFTAPLNFDISQQNSNFCIIKCTFSRTWPVSYDVYFNAIGNDWYKNKPTAIPLHNLLNLNDKIPLCNIRLVESLAQCLYQNSVYQNDKVIVFFNEKAIKIDFSLDNDEIRENFISFIRNINSELRTSIQDFITFMSNSTDKNNSEKWSIFAGQIKKYLDDKDEFRFIEFLNKLKVIKKETKISYESYLSDFSFSKFEKKLEEESEKISSKTLDALKNVQTQIIGIPVLAIIPKLITNTTELNTAVYVMLLIFSIMILFTILVSKDYLAFLSKELEVFSNKLSTNIQKSFSDKQTRLNTIIRSQSIMLYVYYTICILSIVYSLVHICDALFPPIPFNLFDIISG
ncbi:hypothetical protein [Wohlfahrtiimonas chitiniclastica]|uniref:hypothetical protein n=1 Tax=Wohlfahrtiimonas chitiniclastica TaxID=400946 RepID=UPI001BD0D72B|nr:hypothetical protein [Wohlfahrtiimonas chitiniclastica]MBS7819035.1 hypothetical protein [Wohlfahrtiimonas chitiniclastica]